MFLIMKKLINAAESVVDDALAGMAAAHPSLRWIREPGHLPRVGRRERARSGWSPAAARGTSRCTAASSATACSTRPARARSSPRPCPTRCVAATKAVDGGAGVLHIVKNYTGDVLNFEMAAELAATASRSPPVSSTTTSPSRTPSTRRAAAAPARRFRGEDRRALAEEGAAAERRSASVARRGQRAQPLLRRRAHRVHHARGGQADVRPARRRDGAGRRHPRRARPEPGADGLGPRDRRVRVDADPRRPAAGRATCWSWSTAWAARR